MQAYIEISVHLIEKQNETCLHITFKAQTIVCVLQKNYLLSEAEFT